MFLQASLIKTLAPAAAGKEKSMPNLYARQTALTNVGGRIDYISNPKRQEHLLAVHDAADAAYWRLLALECKAASKHKRPGTKSVQGRELVVQLSNSLLRRLTPEEIAKILADSFEKKYGRPCIVAVHYNKDMTNLHAHLIYAERDLLPEPATKVATRALFFDEEGKRHYKKSEVLDEDGELRPGCQIVAKGEIYERHYFGPVDPAFSRKEWLHKAKKEWLLPLRNGELRGDVEITEYDPSSGHLPQQHIGKKAPEEVAEQIQAYNEAAKEFNQRVDIGDLALEDALAIQEEMKKEKRKTSVLLRFLEGMKPYWKPLRPEPEKRRRSLKDILFASDRKKEVLQKQREIKTEKFYAPTNWAIQEDLDKALGTDYAKQDRDKYYAKKAAEKDGR